MTEVVFSGDIFPVVGCNDPLANNYNRSATKPCSGCCRYGSKIVGCTDPLALNYDSKAIDSCNSCCTYQVIETQPVDYNVNLNSLLSAARYDPPPGPGSPSVLDVDICTYYILVSKEDPQQDYPILANPNGYFPQIEVYAGLLLNTSTNNFELSNGASIGIDSWDRLYRFVNGQDFSFRYPNLWQQLLDFVNRGGAFFINTSQTGVVTKYDLSSAACCARYNDGQGNYIGAFDQNYQGLTPNINGGADTDSTVYFGVCESYEFGGNPDDGPGGDIGDGDTGDGDTGDGDTGDGDTGDGGDTSGGDTIATCIATINDFINLINTGPNQFSAIGGNFFNTYFSGAIGPALGLTPQQILFIKNNINSTLDSNGNNIPDLSEARLILSNALQTSGGFYVSQPTTSPSLVSQANCTGAGKYWDSIHSVCMCAPLVTEECLIDITQVQIVTTSTNIQTIVYNNGNPLTEACCNRLIRDYDKVGVWEWQSPNCVVLSSVVNQVCLPAIFSLNNNNMSVLPCNDVVEISMWLYFGTPNNPCQPISKQVYNDIINVEIPANNSTRTPNFNLIERNPSSSNISFIDVNNSVKITDLSPEPTTLSENCCYDSGDPILAKISLNNTLNSSLTQIKEYSSIVDGFDNWVELKATIPSSGVSLNFGVNLEIYQGLSCCCNYDFFVDDIKVGCPEENSIRTRNDVNCIGFNLTKVIDNKKSWVYNPGLPSVGITEYDAIERADGSFGMLNGEGTINRTFAPSLDAEIPWRYTDYKKQSSVSEKHSNLVLNSKELWLTFDMCADCPISGITNLCPQGYTLSANTTICYSGNT